MLNTIDANVEVQERWSEFRNITIDYPNVRLSELNAVLDMLAPKQGERILEAGTGSCYLTFPLAEAIGEGGELISSDVNAEGLSELEARYAMLRMREAPMASITPYHFSDDYFKTDKFPQALNGKLDGVVSLATFHHFDTRAPEFDTGHIGKTSALREFHRMLKPGGRLVIADVCDSTSTQRYFDAVDSPEHFYPTGHPHDFFCLDGFRDTLVDLGYVVHSLEIRDTPWVFDTMEDAAHYINRLHNARCSKEESLAIAEDVVGFKQVGSKYHFQWQLMFANATKLHA